MNSFKSMFSSVTLWAVVGLFLSVAFRAALKKLGLLDDSADATLGLLQLGLIGTAGWGRIRAKQQLATPLDPPGQGSNYSKSVWFALCLAVTLAALGCGGCTQAGRADLIKTRETLVAGTDAVRSEHHDWVHLLGPGGDRNALPRLSATDVEIRDRYDSEFDSYVAQSRAQDKAATKPSN